MGKGKANGPRSTMGRISTFFSRRAEGIGQQSEKCDWPRREQVSFVVHQHARFARVWSSTPDSFHLSQFQSSAPVLLPLILEMVLLNNHRHSTEATASHVRWHARKSVLLHASSLTVRGIVRSVQPVCLMWSQGAGWSWCAVAIRQLPRRDCAWRLRGDLRWGPFNGSKFVMQQPATAMSRVCQMSGLGCTTASLTLPPTGW